MHASKLYRDGNVGEFKQFGKAAVISGAAAIAVSLVIAKLMWRLEWYKNLDAVMLVLLSIVPGLITFAGMIWFFRRPLITIKADRFIYHTGVFSSSWVAIDNIRAIKIFSDTESLSIDIYTKGGPRFTFQTRTVQDLDKAMAAFLTSRVGANVECVGR